MAKLRRRDFYFIGEQWLLRFHEKGGKSREIPVRHDLQGYLSEYLDAAALSDAPKNSPLFRTAIRKEKRLTQTALTTNDVSVTVSCIFQTFSHGNSGGASRARPE